MTFRQFIEEKYGTVSQFSRALGVTWITASKYIKGLQPMRTDHLEKIEDQTGVPMCEIINMKKG